MIKFRQGNLEGKIFSNTWFENIETQGELVLLNILKVCELYESEPTYVHHWCIKIANSLNLISEQKQFGKSIQSFYSLIEPKDMAKILGSNVAKNRIEKYGKTISEIITNCIIEKFLTIGSSYESQKDGKYINQYKNNKNKLNELYKKASNEYPLIFKYFALCLSGQMNPFEDGIWTEIKTIQRTNINYGLEIDKEQILNIIKQCFVQILGSELDCLKIGEYK